MKKDLKLLLIKECCYGKECKNCGFVDLKFNCRLLDIISKLKESEKYEK